MLKVDIVGEKDNVVGCEEKDIAHQRGLWHRMSGIYLTNSEGKLLLQKRSATKDVFPNLWTQSVGGHVDAGESYETAALRELKEELGILNLELRQLHKYNLEEVYEGQKLRHVNVIYSAPYNGETITPDLGEIDKVEWFSQGQIDAMLKSQPQDFCPGFKEEYEIYKKLK